MESHPLRRILYVSTAVVDFSDGDLEKLCESSSDRNAAQRVSGMLVSKGGSFMQVIEGPADSIEELFSRISSDERHTFVETLLDETTSDRFFEGWEMRHCNLNASPPPPTTVLLSIARFLKRCSLADTRPVIDEFIRTFAENPEISLDQRAA